MENIFIKTLNKNLRSLARSVLSAGDYYLKIRLPADYADSADLQKKCTPAERGMVCRYSFYNKNYLEIEYTVFPSLKSNTTCSWE